MSGLLRICTAGSVDDGKSTLIGRLLYDSRAVYEDQVRSVETASRNRTAGPIDFSLFTDGLQAEREQGITIDVAYRYFATARRKFILADTPGHEQYTRNMATGASTADVAILLVDARHGVREQTRRHARIAGLLGISHFVARRQQDGPRRLRPRRCSTPSATSSRRSPAARAVHAIPISALHGDNVIAPSDAHALVRRAEPARVPRDGRGRAPRTRAAAFRFPVQLVVRPDQTFRGYAGQIASGTVRVGRRGDGLAVGPARRRVKRIVTWDGDLESASRADVGHARARGRDRHQPRRRLIALGADRMLGRRFEADVVWMDERPLDPGRVYVLKHSTRDGHGGSRIAALALNEIGLGQRLRVAAAGLRPLRGQPRHRQLHPDRSGDELHGRRRHDRATRCRTTRRARTAASRRGTARAGGARRPPTTPTRSRRCGSCSRRSCNERPGRRDRT